ncbi:MAG: aspartate aminotransferase family protein [Deltaproteobacteria bacterium]|nr:aspartate aminotransferase family protein [Deltaproteobacteria bacterium]
MKTNALLAETAIRAGRYLDGLDERPVAPSAEAVARLEDLKEEFPDQPTDPKEVVELLDHLGSPATVGSAGGRYFGFVIGGSLPAALAANWLAGAWDQNACIQDMSPVAIALENIAAGWLLDALGLPSESALSYVTGATMANFTALVAARQAVLESVGWDVEAQGLFNAPPVTVIVGAEVHPTVLKSLTFLGLGRERVTVVPVDDQGRFRAEVLPSLSGPTIICLQAGNVNTGAFDPVGLVCEQAHPAGAWVHVDGAFGLWAAASPKMKKLTLDLEKADSWATDAHKWLNVPYDCGLAIIKDPRPLRKAVSISAAYLPESERYTPETSRRARGVEVWAALKSLGRQGLADLIERTCGLARRFAAGLADAGLTILNVVVLNQVLVRFGDQATTAKIIKAVQDDGVCWCGGTVWQGNPAMRISVSSWATTERDVDKSLAAIIRVAKRELQGDRA